MPLHYRLALDLGTTSIGWALLRLDENDDPCAVIKLGARIFSDGRNPKNGASLAVDRRLARQMRRRRDRLLKRKRRMMAALIELSFLPADKQAREALVKLDPYALRARGLDAPLSGAEFGRALLHINQRRGFKSNRKTDKRDNDSGVLKSAIKKLRETLDEDGHRTLGEWLASRHAAGEQVRARLTGTKVKDKAYNFYADRSMVEHEFDTLWAAQAAHNPTLFSDKARDELRDILLFQRKLRPVTPGKCTLEPEQRRAPLASPSSQRFRVLQELNNLRLITSARDEVPLSREQRDVLAHALERSKEVKFDRMRRLLKLPGARFNLEDMKRDRLKGNLTSVALGHEKVMGEAWHDLPLAEQDTVVEQLLSVESELELTEWLSDSLKVDSDKAKALAGASLPDGYGRLSHKALARVLPHLTEQVVTYDKAVVAAGYESHSQLAFGETTGEIMAELPYYGIPLQRFVAFPKDNPRNDEERYGKIANPTVHIGLNQIRVVVNALIQRYGPPAQVHIEVARKLKLSRERKLEEQKKQKRNQEENKRYLDEACGVLERVPEHLDKNTRRNLIQKMRLWTELNPGDCLDRHCPFSGRQIGIAQLLSDEVEIEHILPFSQTLDDSMNNKTVAYREANRLKGNRSPFEAFGDNAHADRGYDYDGILLRATKMRNHHKSKRFAADAMKQWREENDFLARALTDTAYLARVAKQYLSCVCPHSQVVTVPGRLTALLRGHYGLNQLLSGSERKNRNDHRHHAIDAAVIGITDRSLLKRVADASSAARQQQLARLIDDMPQPWPSFRDHVARAVLHIHVSHRPDHGYQGQMHEDTAWGFARDGQATMRQRDDDGNRSRIYKNKTLIPITEPGLARHGATGDGAPKPYKGYVGGSNYCIEITCNEKGRWVGNVISTFEAYTLAKNLGELSALRRLRDKRNSSLGMPLVMRLMIDDSIELGDSESRQIYRVVKIGSNGRVFLAPLHESNVDARNRDPANPFKYISKTASTLQQSGCKLVTISPIGVKTVH